MRPEKEINLYTKCEGFKNNTGGEKPP